MPGFQCVGANGSRGNQPEPGREIEPVDRQRADRRAAVVAQNKACPVAADAINQPRRHERRRDLAAAFDEDTRIAEFAQRLGNGRHIDPPFATRWRLDDGDSLVPQQLDARSRSAGMKEEDRRLLRCRREPRRNGHPCLRIEHDPVG